MHLASLLARQARWYPSRIAIIDEQGTWTFPGFVARLSRLGHALHGLGLTPGDRVALLLPDMREYLEVDYGSMSAGLVRVPLDPRLPRADLRALLRHAGASALVAHADFADRVEGLAAEVESLRFVIAVGGTMRDALDYETILAAAKDTPFEGSDGEALATLNFSGGTTGAPKAIMLRHRSLAAVLQNTIPGFGIAPDDVFLNIRPLWPIAQLVMMAHLVAGCPVVLGGRFTAETFADQFERSGATRSSLVPTQLIRLLPHLRPGDPRLSRLRAITIGGSRVRPADFSMAWERLGPRIGVLYGLTEAPISAHLHPSALDAVPEEREAAAETVGRELFGAEIRLATATGPSAAAGAEGEVLIRGAHVMAGYWRDEATTAAALTEGWLRTGDIGRFDEAGRLVITGRLKEVIRSGASSIVPAEVEDAIASHPAVAEVAVVGLPDREWGEVVAAFIVVCPGASLDGEAVIAHCRDRLAPHKKPRQVRFVTSIPRSHYGKVLRQELVSGAVA